jgi:hypothetical protein
MTYYQCLYCRIFNYFNFNGENDKINLRMSSFGLLSILPTVNILTVVYLISFIVKHTIINKWEAVGIDATIFVFNLLTITTEKSDTLREEFEGFTIDKKRKINLLFYSYVMVTMILLITITGYTAYYKSKYGNYDR